MGRGLLIIVSGFLIVFGLVQNSVQRRQKVLAKRSPEYYYNEQSRNIAASTAEVALKKLNDLAKNTPGIDPCPSIKDNISYSEQTLNGIGKIDCYKSTPPSFFNSRIFLEVIGTPNQSNIKTTIHAVVNRPAFSIYAYFTIEEPVIYFADGDVLNGPVHTNGTFHIDGDPVFNGKVSSPHKPIEEWGSNPQYNAGYDFPADSIDLPNDLGELSDKAASGGLQFTDDKIKVKFKSDGTADITQYQESSRQQGNCIRGHYEGNFWNRHYVCDEYEQIITYSEGPTQNYNLSDAGFNGIISSGGKVEVEGTVKGNITLHSKDDIRITGDVVYDDFNPNNPDKELDSSNLLGIVSQGNVIVDKDAYKNGANTSENLNITASIMAMGESFEVEDYNKGNHRGQLRILGGLIQKKRGPVGTSGGTGYDKHYTYDKRLLKNSTPDFPKVKRFQIDSWKETTHKISAN